jgi:RNA polymerase I specific transcription initiation factor RRN3
VRAGIIHHEASCLAIPRSRLAFRSCPTLVTIPAGWEGRPDAQSKPTAVDSDTSQRSLDMAHKLDAFLNLLYQHLRWRSATDRDGLWHATMDAFEHSVLLSQRVKFTPFLMFLCCHLCGDGAAQRFVEALIKRIRTPVRFANAMYTMAG